LRHFPKRENASLTINLVKKWILKNWILGKNEHFWTEKTHLFDFSRRKFD
jgi:hypothetical protein